MSRRTDYKTCPDCGAHLDAGERCDCGGRAETQKEEEPCHGRERD